jgi:hypothetical protein
VLRFMSGIESLPFYSRRPTMIIQNDGTAWQGSVELFVTITT